MRKIKYIFHDPDDMLSKMSIDDDGNITIPINEGELPPRHFYWTCEEI